LVDFYGQNINERFLDWRSSNCYCWYRYKCYCGP